MEKVAEFLDVANLEAAFRLYEVNIDFIGLRDYLAAGRLLLETFCYVPVSPYRPIDRRPMLRFLQRNGFFVRHKIGRRRPGNRFKCDFDIEIACDILRYVQHTRPDVVVVGSGDRDFMPVYRILRETGVRVEVASTRATVADDILDAASAFIDIGKIIQVQSIVSQPSQTSAA